MIISIVGSRSFSDFDLLDSFILQHIDIKKIDGIISGGATGTDKLAEHFAAKYLLPIEIILPDWKLYGKKAAIIRNIEIVKKADFILAFWDGKSKGTAFIIKEAKRKNKGYLLEVV